MGIAVAYLPGTAMRRTAQLLPGDAKTDRRDAHVIAWAALKLPETLRDAGSDDETLAALRMLAGHDEETSPTNPRATSTACGACSCRPTPRSNAS